MEASALQIFTPRRRFVESCISREKFRWQEDEEKEEREEKRKKRKRSRDSEKREGSTITKEEMVSEGFFIQLNDHPLHPTPHHHYHHDQHKKLSPRIIYPLPLFLPLMSPGRKEKR